MREMTKIRKAFDTAGLCYRVAQEKGGAMLLKSFTAEEEAFQILKAAFNTPELDGFTFDRLSIHSTTDIRFAIFDIKSNEDKVLTYKGNVAARTKHAEPTAEELSLKDFKL